jgi:hypothetical protein
MNDRNYDFVESAVDELRSADRRIDELEDALEAARSKAAEWIPVSERLPKPGQQVLAAIPPRVWNEENQALIETLDYEQEGFYSWKDDEWQKRVTHWMPLPEPPEVR